MIKKLMKSIREYKKDSLLSPAMVTLEVIMEVIIPMLMARLIDYVFRHRTWDISGRWVFCLLSQQ